MTSNAPILQDLAIIVTGAAGAAIVAPRLKVPALPAYLIVGILMGVFNRHATFLGEVETVAGLSNLGVTFLMFSMGLEFDFSKARSLIVPAILAVLLQFPPMLALGSGAAAVLELTRTEGLFIGGLLTISSTMVAAATLKALGHTERTYGRLTIAVIVLEDIAAIVLLAVLAGMGAGAGHRHGSGGIMNTLFLVGAFMTLLFTGGRLVLRRWLPTMGLEKLPESLAVVVGGLVLGVGLLSEKFGASGALAAFTVGAALAQTRIATHIEHVAEPFRNLFSAVFFVTLGIGIRPETLLEVAPVAIPLALLMIAGKAAAYWLGSFLGGQKPTTSLRMALNNAHIGEFSFVIAGIGEASGITTRAVTATLSSVALISIFLHRPIVGSSEKAIAFFRRKMTPQLRQAGDFYGNLLATVAGQFDRAMLWRVLRKPLASAAIHLLFFFTILGCAHLLCVHAIDASETWMLAGVWIAAAAASSIFVIALARNLEAMVMVLAETAFPHSHLNSRRGKAMGIVTHLLQVGVVMMMSAVILTFALPWMNGGLLALAPFFALAVAAWFLRNLLSRAQSRFELLFIESFNLAAKTEESDRRTSSLHAQVRRHKWPLHLREHKIEPGTRAANARLVELDLRAATGAFVTAVQRDGHSAFAPSPGTPLFPGDELMLLGTEDQLSKALSLLSAPAPEGSEEESGFLMDQVFVAHDSTFTGETLAGAALRRAYGVTIAGVQRGETQHLSPGPEFIIKANDILLVAGRVSDVIRFRDAASGGLREE